MHNTTYNVEYSYNNIKMELWWVWNPQRCDSMFPLYFTMLYYMVYMYGFKWKPINFFLAISSSIVIGSVLNSTCGFLRLIYSWYSIFFNMYKFQTHTYKLKANSYFQFKYQSMINHSIKRVSVPSIIYMNDINCDLCFVKCKK